MTDSIYQAFFVSILRAMLLVAGGWLVGRGLVDDGLMREVAAGLAVVVVTQMWTFYVIHRRRLYERWCLLLGIEADPATAPEVIQAEARARVRDGMLP